MSNDSKKGGGGAGAIIAILLVIGLLGSCGGNSSSKSSRSSYEDTLKSGLDKYYSGQSMSNSEYKAVESYNKWKYKNSDHTYDSWSNHK